MLNSRQCTRFIPVVFVFSILLAACATPTSSVAPDPAPVTSPRPTQQTPVAGTTTTTTSTVPSQGFTSRGEEVSAAIEQYGKETRCQYGNGSKGAPIICVDNSTIRPHPYNAEVWDFEGVNGTPTILPVVIHWYARRAGDLAIQFVPGGDQCVKDLVCDKGRAHCSAVVMPLAGASSRTCKYHVWIDGVILDKSSPGIQVNPCCW